VKFISVRMIVLKRKAVLRQVRGSRDAEDPSEGVVRLYPLTVLCEVAKLAYIAVLRAQHQDTSLAHVRFVLAVCVVHRVGLGA
jgi:hypothetical protein